MKRIILILTIIISLTDICSANNFKYLRTSEGLSNGEVNSIVQDETGKMWIATWAGLISYDGYRFRLYRPELGNAESLPDKKVKDLHIDKNGKLWVVTAKNLCFFNERKRSFNTIHFDRNEIDDVNILYLYESDGYLIVHAVEGFYIYPINQIENPEYKAKKISVVNNNEVFQTYINYSASYKSSLCLGVNGDEYNPSRIFFADLRVDQNDTLIEINKTVEIKGNLNSVEYVKSENNLYFSTSNGILPYSLLNNNFTGSNYFKGENILHSIYTSDNKLYCYSLLPELLYIDLHTGQTGKYVANPNKVGTLLDNVLSALFEDFSGNLWIGHQGQGISIMNLNRKDFFTYRRDASSDKSLSSNTVMTFEGTEDEIFIGTRTSGLNITSKYINKTTPVEFDLLSYQQKARPDSEFDRIWNIGKESDSVFWVGSDGGLASLKKINGKWLYGPPGEEPIIRNVVRKVFIDDNNNIWCGTYRNGLIFIPAIQKNPEGKFYEYHFDADNPQSVSSEIIQEIKLDSKGRFWIGTYNGVCLLKPRYENLDLSGKIKPQLKFKRYVAVSAKDNYLNNNEINSIFENFDGNIWIATQGGRINILDPETDSIEHFKSDEDLIGNDVFGILSDDLGNLWISTNNGLQAFNQFRNNSSLTPFNSADGIQGETFMVNSYYKSSDGEMFFGGDNGFTRFYPKNIRANNIRPKIAFTDLKVFNKTVYINDTINNKILLKNCLNETAKIVLPFVNNTFSIGVSSMHYQHTGGNKITYLLDGYDEIWKTIPASNEFIEFSNLPFGKYTLKVKAISSENVESQNIKILQIEISPPWYRTWYMSVFFILFAVSVFVGFILIIINRQRLIYQKRIDDITIDNNESKMVFLTNIAHELRTPLSLVIAPIDDIMQNYKDLDPLWKNHVQLIYRNSNYLLKLINQIVDFRKLNAGKLKLYMQNTDILKVIKDVVLNFKYLESQRNVNLNIKVPAKKIIVSIDSQKIEEVLYNLLSNAFKHTDDHNSITVSLDIITKSINESGSDDKQLKITVFNEGKDISGNDKTKIFERFYKTDESIDGAGIGLSFSKSLIEMHKGTIDVESVKDRGVAFNIYLPYDKNIEDDSEVEVTQTEQFLYNEEDFDYLNNNESAENMLKIVIVEDNNDLRVFLKNVLSRIYICYEAKNGQEGLKLIKEIIPDIVISDVIMPKKDGFQMCKQIKENLKTCHIPVILLTAKNAADQIISGYDVGADAYVTKPFDMNLIISQISRLIKNRELIREKYVTQNFMVEVSKTNPSKDDEFIVDVRKLLEENLSDPEFNVKKLSHFLNISTTQLYRKLKVLTGYSPVEFIRVIKLQKAYDLLNDRHNTVKEVCYLSGFNNLSYFIKCFREHFGVTPANYRDKGFTKQIAKDNTNITNI